MYVSDINDFLISLAQDVLYEVLTSVGDKWVASVHECVSDDGRHRRRAVLNDTDKTVALSDYRIAYRVTKDIATGQCALPYCH